jgi:hypothetical protein
LDSNKKLLISIIMGEDVRFVDQKDTISNELSFKSQTSLDDIGGCKLIKWDVSL